MRAVGRRYSTTTAIFVGTELLSIWEDCIGAPGKIAPAPHAGSVLIAPGHVLNTLRSGWGRFRLRADASKMP
jgi:hypothetical protein